MRASVATDISALAEENSRLSAIAKEAIELDAKLQPTWSETGQSAAVRDGLSLAAFEEDLKARYKRSYTFPETVAGNRERGLSGLT
jgi:hypothetical protein